MGRRQPIGSMSLKSISGTVERKPVVKQSSFITPVIIYCDKPNADGFVGRYMFPCNGVVRNAMAKIKKQFGGTLCIRAFDEETSQAYEVPITDKIIRLENEFTVDCGDEIEIHIKGDNGKTEGIAIAFLYRFTT